MLSKTEQGYMLELLVLHFTCGKVSLKPVNKLWGIYFHNISYIFCLIIFYSLESLFYIYFVYLRIIYLTYYQAALYNSIQDFLQKFWIHNMQIYVLHFVPILYWKWPNRDLKTAVRIEPWFLGIVTPLTENNQLLNISKTMVTWNYHQWEPILVITTLV